MSGIVAIYAIVRPEHYDDVLRVGDAAVGWGSGPPRAFRNSVTREWRASHRERGWRDEPRPRDTEFALVLVSHGEGLRGGVDHATYCVVEKLTDERVITPPHVMINHVSEGIIGTITPMLDVGWARRGGYTFGAWPTQWGPTGPPRHVSKLATVPHGDPLIERALFAAYVGEHLGLWDVEIFAPESP